MAPFIYPRGTKTPLWDRTHWDYKEKQAGRQKADEAMCDIVCEGRVFRFDLQRWRTSKSPLFKMLLK